jgi:hypothetical protein
MRITFDVGILLFMSINPIFQFIETLQDHESCSIQFIIKSFNYQKQIKEINFNLSTFFYSFDCIFYIYYSLVLIFKSSKLITIILIILFKTLLHLMTFLLLKLLFVLFFIVFIIRVDTI